jgi:hypothetical protein
MVMTLFDVGVEGSELEQLLEEAAGELTPELEARLDEFLCAGKDKINAALMVRRRMEYEARACREEAERLWARAKSIDGQREKLSGRILMAVDHGFQGKVKTAFFTAYGSNCGAHDEFYMAPDADIAQFADTNPDLVRVTRELNKTALKDLVKSGGELPPEVAVDAVPGKRVLVVR